MSVAYCFDFDGTVTATELLPCIASELGVSEELETLTRVTMDGILSFHESLRLRALILGTVPVPRVHQIVDDVPLDPDVREFIGQRPDDCFIVTGNLDLWLSPAVTRLGCEAFWSTGQLVDGRVVLKDTLHKADAVADLRSRGYDRIVAIGDGANDVPMFAAADFAIAFGGVHTPAAPAVAAADFVVHEGRQLCRTLAGL